MSNQYYQSTPSRPHSRPPSTLTIDPPPLNSRRSSSLNLISPNQDPLDEDRARRTYEEGDMGEMKQALWSMLTRVDELSAQVHSLLTEQEDLNTSLTVAKSNLTLALSNNEMLEEALARTPASAQPLGWRRHSARDGVHREVQSAAPDYPQRRSWDTVGSIDSSPEELTFWQSLTRPASAAPRPSTPHPPLTAIGVMRERQSLTSASTPALLDGTLVEVERLRDALRNERAQSESLKKEKAGLEQEIESLSQALFEEANKMVSDERKRRAAAEIDLQEMRDEREAMKRTLRMVEEENRKLRRGEALPGLALSGNTNTSTTPELVYPSPSRALGYEQADKDMTPTQPERPPSDAASVRSEMLDDGVRIDRVWLDAISPPVGSFPRPLNLVSGFGTTPPNETSSLAAAYPNHPTLNLRRSPGQQHTSLPPSPNDQAGGYFPQPGSYLSAGNQPGYGWAGGNGNGMNGVGEGLRRLELVPKEL
ncbi:hypothetical protein DACRYDRAFT_106982 [Dacryopinax primogenitus]|uniref:GDP/GTP exchange factor Sec2 N-terminal domain-containing protein n=1 Tax=Dacryopinax primogenitus (strain DJM 731) TaxID=1858805 RepID=M5GE19_DACPD|nr:uncharacterized protein DACRYDRAFT_106982 [Dacryopinax primogenitus]EJU02898.1 hypothetical protein DACRYDRAFT_106982 [Dacryopinax primogenitus]